MAAANGQFLLVQREAYVKIGGHEAVADAVLEDVELANIAKRRRLGLRFRYAPEAVSTRMYRSFGAMLEGWTKNLALLFGNPLPMAGMKVVQLVVMIGIAADRYFLWETTGARVVRGRTDAGVGSLAVGFLPEGGEIEFPVYRLPDHSAGCAVVCRDAVAKLVSAYADKARNLEGTGICEPKSLKPGMQRSHLTK